MILVCGVEQGYITAKPPGLALPVVVVASARRGVHFFTRLCDILEKTCSSPSCLIVYVYKHKEAKMMHHYNDAELDFTALSHDERAVLQALRDPAKAARLYALLALDDSPHDSLVALSGLSAVPN